MRKNQTSLTAIGVAIARAVESEKPSNERICYDPFARKFVPGWMYCAFGFLIKSGYAERRGTGVNGYLVARDRYIDDVLQNAIENNLQQLVILGAGYDSRAYRFNLKDRVKVFEIDHPATQADKIAKVARIFGNPPASLTYIPIDFNRQTLEGALLKSSYDPGLITLFIWQGVTMYLTPAAVDATLAFIASQSSPGSAIVFDYVYQAVLDGTQKRNEIKSMYRYRFLTGEVPTFGIAEGKTEEFMKERGFKRVKDVRAEYLKQTYFTGTNATRKIATGYGILTAWV